MIHIEKIKVIFFKSWR